MSYLFKVFLITSIFICHVPSHAHVNGNSLQPYFINKKKLNDTLLDARQGDANAMHFVAYDFKYKKNSYQITAKEYIYFLKKMIIAKKHQGYSMLADEYIEGKLLKKDKKKAIELWNKILLLPMASKSAKAMAYNSLAMHTKDKQKEIVLLKKAANLDNIASLYDLAVYYSSDSSNHLIKKDYKKAFQYRKKLLKVATKKEGYFVENAHISLGLQYLDGLGVQQNDSLAIKHLEKAAALGNSDALFELGYLYVNGTAHQKNVKKGIDFLAQAIKKNNVNAVIQLSMLYDEGIHVPQDIKKAESIYKQALTKKFGKYDKDILQKKLNTLYDFYPALLPEYEQTKKEIERKASQGDTNALIELATMYEEGLVVKKDFKKAIQILSELASQRNAQATLNLSSLYRKHAIQYPHMQEHACNLQEQAAKLGHPLAKLFLASDYQDDDDCRKKNIDKTIEIAEEIFKQASHNDSKAHPFSNIDFKIHAAILLHYNYFTRQLPNYKKSFKYGQFLINANEQNISWVFYRIGYMYEHGLGVKKDIKSAIKMYQISSKDGVQKATERLNELKQRQ